MKIACFLDTSILMYAAAGKKDEARKQSIARNIIEEGAFCISAQVLAEFFVNFQRKPEIKPSIPEVDHWMKLLEDFTMLPVDIDLVRAGMMMSRRYQIHYWDAALVAAADRIGVPVFFTEDLNHGQKYGSVTAINPFKAH